MAELFRKGFYAIGTEIRTISGKFFTSKKEIKNAGTEPTKTNTYWQENKPDYEAQAKELAGKVAERDQTIATLQQELEPSNMRKKLPKLFKVHPSIKVDEVAGTIEPTVATPPVIPTPPVIKTPDYAGAVISLDVVNAATDTVIGPLTEGAKVNAANLAFEAHTAVNGVPGKVGALVWELLRDGGLIKTTTEQSPRYAFPSNSGDNFGTFSPPLTPGNYELVATPYSSTTVSTRKAGTPLRRKFTIVEVPVVHNDPVTPPIVVTPPVTPTTKKAVIHMFKSRSSAVVEKWAASQANVKMDMIFVDQSNIYQDGNENALDKAKLTRYLQDVTAKPGDLLLLDWETQVFKDLNGTDSAKVKAAEQVFYDTIKTAKAARPDLKVVLYGAPRQKYYESQHRDVARYDRIFSAADGILSLLYINIEDRENAVVFGKSGHEGNKEMIRRNLANAKEASKRTGKPVYAIIYQLVHPTNTAGYDNQILTDDQLKSYVQTILEEGVTDIVLWSASNIVGFNRGGVNGWCKPLNTQSLWDNNQIRQVGQWVNL